MERIAVADITSDRSVRYGKDICLHHIVCDHIYDNGHIRKQAPMICSYAEYESIMKNSYYEVKE